MTKSVHKLIYTLSKKKRKRKEKVLLKIENMHGQFWVAAYCQEVY